jgi:hypothetical protein
MAVGTGVDGWSPSLSLPQPLRVAQACFATVAASIVLRRRVDEAPSIRPDSAISD